MTAWLRRLFGRWHAHALHSGRRFGHSHVYVGSHHHPWLDDA